MLTFKIFGDYTEAKEIFDVLTAHHLTAELEDNSERFNPSFVSTPFSKQYRVKMAPTDFNRAMEVCRDYFSDQVKQVESDYYLYAFSDAELKEILVKPDEWSLFDYFLAEYLLRQRGVETMSDEIEQEKEKHLETLSRPDKRPWGMIIFGYLLSLGFFGMLLGWMLFNSKKTLYNGEVVHTYEKRDRTHGYIIFTIALVNVIVVFTFRLFFVN